VTVNGVDADVAADGRFQAQVPVVSGENVIEVIAENALGRQAFEVFKIISLALPNLPLFLIVTEPRDQSVVFTSPIPVSGRTAFDAVVSVNGVSVPVNELGIFSTAVELEVGVNFIDVVATDPEGDTLNVPIAIIYSLESSQ